MLLNPLMIELLSPHIPLLEKYLLAKDKQLFITTIKNTSDKKLLLLLINPLPENYQEVFKQLNFQQHVQNWIKSSKWMPALKEQTNVDNRNILIQKILKQFYKDQTFDYVKPVDTVVNSGQIIQNSKSKLSFFQMPQTLQKYLQQSISQDPQKFESLTQYGLKQLSQNFILKQSHNNKRQLVNKKIRYIKSFSDDFVANFLLIYCKEEARNRGGYQYQYIKRNMIANLSKSQINLIRLKYQDIMKNKQFLEIWFKVNYQPIVKQKSSRYKKKNVSLSVLNQRRSILLKAYQQLKQLNLPLLKSHTSKLLLKLLLLDIQRQDPSKQLLIQFILRIQNPCNILSSQLQIKVNQNCKEQNYDQQDYYGQRRGGGGWGRRQGGGGGGGEQAEDTQLYFTDNQIIEKTLDKLFRKYHQVKSQNNLQQFYKKYQDIKDLKKELHQYLDIDFVNKTHAQVKLSKGQQVQNLQDIFTKQQIQDLKQTKQITILQQKTQSYYKATDDVVLSLRLKNVSEIKVKIYEMNLQKFYLQNIENDLDSQISLLYLDPTIQQVIQLVPKRSPFLITHQQLTLQSLPSIHGCYIIQLQSSGLISRAIIKKGAIVCFQQNHIDGKMLKFYDQDGNRIQKMGIWVKGRYFNLIKGEFVVPFGSQTQNITVVAVKDRFAEKIQVQVGTESYCFKFGMIYNHQSFIVGKKAKVILHPTLDLDGERISLQNIKKAKITTHLTNSNGIKSSKRDENIKLTDNLDYVLQIAIKQYTSQIQIQVDIQVLTIQGTTSALCYNNNLSIDLLKQSQNIMDLYLKRQDNGHTNVVQLRGLNGEPYPGVQITLEMTVDGCTETEETQLTTDSNGQVKLKNLSYVNKLKASFLVGEDQSNSRTWTLNQQSDSLQNLNNQYDYHYYQGDDALIHIPSSWQVNQQNINSFLTFSLTRQNQEYLYENRIKQASIKIIHGITYLFVSKIKEGHYQLNLLKLGQNITIRVVTGKKWEDGHILNQQSGVVTKINKNPYLSIRLGDIKEQVGQKPQTIKVTLPIQMSQQQYKQLDISNIQMHILLQNHSTSCTKYQRISDYFQLLHFNKHPYLTSKSLSLNLCTFHSNKQLSDQQQYVLHRQKQSQLIGNNLEKPRLFLNRIEVRQTQQIDEDLREGCEGERCPYDDDQGGWGGGGGDRPKQGRKKNKNIMNTQLPFSSHNNFYQHSGHSISNIKFNRFIQVIIPKGYSELVVYITSSKSAMKKNYFLKNSQISTKDLRNEGLKQVDSALGWSISREIYPLLKGESKQISRSSIWCTVTLTQIIQVALSKGITLPVYITLWSSFSLKQKLSLYNTQSCHQLNVFLKYQDPSFFSEYVLPFIKNKLKRTFVDNFLIGDKSWMHYSKVNSIQTLNQFQKVLLVQAMVDNNMKQQAKDIAISMTLKAKANKQPFDTYKNLFDTILNSGTDAAVKNIASSKPQVDIIKQQSAIIPQRQMFFNQEQKMQGQQYGGGVGYQYQQQENGQDQYQNQARQQELMVRQPRALKPGFKQVQKTKQYTQVTYSGIKNPQLSSGLVSVSQFWSSLATHLASHSPSVSSYLSQSFMYLSTYLQFTLACIFLPNHQNAEYQLKSKNNQLVVQACNGFLLFVKEIKRLEYQNKFGVMINQRLFDQQNKYIYEDDGTQIQKKVQQFLVKKTYTLQTIVTNTSGTSLQLQVLIDIPSGSIPLKNHEYTQIVNTQLNAYSTISFEREFYFPSAGSYSLHPANASRSSIIISKSTSLPIIKVLTNPTKTSQQSLSDILRTGSQKEVLQFIERRNIFDNKVFDVTTMLYMLLDKQFYLRVVQILKKRNYFDQRVWRLAVKHKDIQTLIQFIQFKNDYTLKPVKLPIFQYFPYYSTRAHKFVDENKSTIRNVQLQQTYQNFIICSMFENKQSSQQKLTFAYYLLLQDKISQSFQIFSTLSPSQIKSHQIQCDYLSCYLSMYLDYPNFTNAAKISQQYLQYPIQQWRKLFVDVYQTLKKYRNKQNVQNVVKTNIGQFRTKVINDQNEIKLKIPSGTKVQVYLHKINLQLHFSQNAFEKLQSLSVVKPQITKTFPSGQFRDQIIPLQSINSLGPCLISIYQFKPLTTSLLISSFVYSTSLLKTNINQAEGSLEVYFNGEALSGCYVKVYVSKDQGTSFYRDGYTDVNGQFRYAMGNLQGINKFAILTMTKQAGHVHQVNPPQQSNYY